MRSAKCGHQTFHSVGATKHTNTARRHNIALRMQAGAILFLSVFTSDTSSSSAALSLKPSTSRRVQLPSWSLTRRTVTTNGNVSGSVDSASNFAPGTSKPKWRGHLHRNAAIVFPVVALDLCHAAASASSRDLRHALMFWRVLII